MPVKSVKGPQSSKPKLLTVHFDGPYPAYSETQDVLADCRHRKAGGFHFWAIKVRGETKLLWNGLWREGTRERLPEFLRASSRLFEAAKRNLMLEQFFIAPLDVEDRMRRRDEGATAKSVRKDRTASSLFPPDVRVLGRLTTEVPIPVHIRVSKKVLGLPEQLDVWRKNPHAKGTKDARKRLGLISLCALGVRLVS